MNTSKLFIIDRWLKFSFGWIMMLHKGSFQIKINSSQTVNNLRLKKTKRFKIVFWISHGWLLHVAVQLNSRSDDDDASMQ
jgi:hypothetical protein